MPDHHRHGSSNDAASLRGRQRRALTVALVLNVVLLVGEAVAGFLLGSLALLADAAHQLSDVAGLGVALLAHRLMDAPRSGRHSYGLLRAEVLGAQANGLLLLGTSVYIVIEAVGRIGSPVEVPGAAVAVVALLALVVNAGSAVWLARVRGSSLNVGGAVAHLAADAGGSAAAVAAGVVIALGGSALVDPAAAMLIAALVVRSAWSLLRDTFHVLMEGAPRDLDPDAVIATLEDHPAVESVHHLHLWLLASDTPALSAHVVLAGRMNLHTAQTHGERLKDLVADVHGVTHATLELECHECEPEDATTY